MSTDRPDAGRDRPHLAAAGRAGRRRTGARTCQTGRPLVAAPGAPGGLRPERRVGDRRRPRPGVRGLRVGPGGRVGRDRPGTDGATVGWRSRKATGRPRGRPGSGGGGRPPAARATCPGRPSRCRPSRSATAPYLGPGPRAQDLAGRARDGDRLGRGREGRGPGAGPPRHRVAVSRTRSRRITGGVVVRLRRIMVLDRWGSGGGRGGLARGWSPGRWGAAGQMGFCCRKPPSVVVRPTPDKGGPGIAEMVSAFPAPDLQWAAAMVDGIAGDSRASAPGPGPP